jgi:hypothetical protein
MAADAISTEIGWGPGWKDINPVLNAAPGRLARLGYFAAMAWVLEKLERELEERVGAWAGRLLRAWVGAVEAQMLADNHEAGR